MLSGVVRHRDRTFADFRHTIALQQPNAVQKRAGTLGRLVFLLRLAFNLYERLNHHWMVLDLYAIAVGQRFGEVLQIAER